MKNSVLAAFVFGLFFSSCVVDAPNNDFPEWEDWYSTPPSISIELEVPEIISGSEFLHYRINLTNISDKVVSVWAGKSFSRNLEFDLAVVNAEGKMVWVRFPRDAVYILRMYGVTLEPAESYTMDGSWNLRDIHGRPIPTGIYTLYGGLHFVELHVDGERTHEYDAPVGSESYTVEVIR